MFKSIKKISIITLAALFLLAGLWSAGLKAASVGQQVSSLQLIDPDDKPKPIPSIGKKVITIMYTDPDVKDVNDPLSEAIKAKDFPKSKYVGIGIANCKDTWIPNAGIRYKARQKQSQFPDSVILLDENKTVSQAWGLGNCDGVGVVIVIGKDGKVKFVQRVSSKSQSSSIIPQVMKILEQEIAK